MCGKPSYHIHFAHKKGEFWKRNRVTGLWCSVLILPLELMRKKDRGAMSAMQTGVPICQWTDPKIAWLQMTSSVWSLLSISEGKGKRKKET